MDEKTKKRLQKGLTEAIEKWLEDDDITLPCWVGDNITSIMADAAFAVLYGVADAQKYLVVNGFMDNE